MPDLNKLKTVLFEHKKTYADCANALNISVTTFNDKIDGKRKFSVEEAQELSNLLELPEQLRIDIFLTWNLHNMQVLKG